jgi:CRISPR/Cas system-associated endonuclease/helicase Cas3
MDLSTVLEKLKDQEYPNYESWASDVVLIFDNAVAYNLPHSLIGGIALYLKRGFQKRVKSLRCVHNLRNYEANFFELCRELDDLIANPPNDFKENRKLDSDVSKLDDFSEERLKNLVDRLNERIGKGDLSKIMKVLRDAGEDVVLGRNPDVDLAGVNRGALIALEAWAFGANGVD